MSEVFDVDTVGYDPNVFGGYYKFFINNTFYLLAPDYYLQFYTSYLKPCLEAYDGWVESYHNIKSGLTPQKMLQSIANGLNNMLFAHGIDFSGDPADYDFAMNWSKKTKFYKTLKKSHKMAIAGGTSLLKINRENNDLFVSAHRIDTFFVDIDANDKILSVKVFYDAIHNTNASEVKEHYGICEERYFNSKGIPCIRQCIYKSSESMVTDVSARQYSKSRKVKWENLDPKIKAYIMRKYPSIALGKEQYLPFKDSLGCVLIKFTDDIPQIPNSKFGQPIGDILRDENFQIDQMKFFEKNEVDLARARALVPEEFWNKDDPNYDSRALNERFYQKISSINGDSDKVTPIQFNLRGHDMRVQKENIYKDCAFKLNVSASSIASFLSEGAGAKTATEIVNERTKSDTWLKGQINLNAPEINELLSIIMHYYNKNDVEIVLKAEDQSPQIERLKINSDVFGAGNMSPERFVKATYGNTISKAEQNREIEFLKGGKYVLEEEKQENEE